MENIVLRRFPVDHRQWMARLLHRFLRRNRQTYPVFSSIFCYLNYILHVAADLHFRRCDIVHIHNFSQFIPIVRALNPEAKIVLHMHCEWLSQLEPRVIRPRLRKTDLILGCSEFITERIRLCFPRFSERCRCIYNGVDVRHFLPAPADTEKNTSKTRTLLFLGRISPEKGLHVLLEAFRIVLQVYPQTRLEIVGPKIQAPAEFIVNISPEREICDLKRFYIKSDPDCYIRLLETTIQSQGMANQIVFFNALPHPEVVERYHHADVFVLPSVLNEPFGIPVIEAMACGVPVVAVGVGGVSEIVEDGKSGFLVERGNVHAMARAILRLLGDEPLRQSLALAGRQRAMELFSWNKIAEELKVKYSQLFRPEKILAKNFVVQKEGVL
jgi:glycosyltransferase involved in cell wall biosynthesis